MKDDGSNYTYWVHNLRIILVSTQKNYVLDAPLGARPAAGATANVMNVWQSKADDYSIVQCAMLYFLESGLQKCFKQMPELRDMKSPTSSIAAKWRRIVYSVNIYSKCLGIITTRLSCELIF